MDILQDPPSLFADLVTAEDDDLAGRAVINRSLYFVDRAGVRVVFRWHEPLYRFALSDTLSVRFVAVHLRLGNAATQEEVCRSFGHSVATQRRWEKRFQEQGLPGLESGKSSGRPSGVPETSDALLGKWFAQGIPNTEMARRLAVSNSAIHRALARLGLRRRPTVSAELPWPEEHPETTGAEQLLPADAPLETPADEQRQDAQATTETASAEIEPDSGDEVCEEPSTNQVDRTTVASSAVVSLSDCLAQYAERGFTIDTDPDNRAGDRGLACLGQLDDATPLFGDRPSLRQAGVLLAVPLLVKSGLLDTFSQVYGSLGPAFYGLRTTIVVLFLSALLRIKRPEHFKEYNPRELGHVMGLDRAPEVKTIRRKLTELAFRERARELMRAAAQRRIDDDPERVAFLYVDGHVHEYHGGQPLAKAKKSQHQVAKPGATDNWVHDANGEPLLVITSEMNEGLTQVLEPILQEVKELIGDRRPTVIFDRGGYSPKLFARLVALGFEVMTYRKGKTKPWPKSHFVEQEFTIHGRTYRYQAAERKRVKVGRLRPKRKKRSRRLGPEFFWMREVRVLRADGRQTSILTTRQEIATVEVPYRQFNRWRQENYFKYMAAEFELDGLLEYEVQDVASETDRPNPARRPLERELSQARSRVQRLQAELGEAAGRKGQSAQRTVHGFKIAHAELRAELAAAEAEVSRLAAELALLPKRVPADDLKTLTTEKKLIADTIKMTAYQVETELLGLLGNHYSRTDDEGRTLLQAAFQSTARIEVRERELCVELAPQSSPHRSEAIRRLCADLNAVGMKFPGTHLRLSLSVQPHEPLTNPQGVCQDF